MADHIVVSGSSAAYFPLLQDLIISSAPARKRHRSALGILDFGLPEHAVTWLVAQGAVVVRIDAVLAALPEIWRPPSFLPYVTRPMLDTYFPGHGTILWLDADTWFQDAEALDAFIEGAARTDLTIVAERHPGYRYQAWLQAWMLKHFIAGYGVRRGLWLMTRSHLNAGAFALRTSAPHWALWKKNYAIAFDRTGRALPHDQFALNQIVYENYPDARILPAMWNWIGDRGPPYWDDAKRCFCTPDASHEPIRIMALAGPAKRLNYRVPKLGGGFVETNLRFAAFEKLRGDTIG